MLEVVVLARLHGHRSPLPLVSRGSGKEKGSPKTSKKPMFSLSISREEIEVDIFSMTGSRMSRNPKKRPKAVQKQLDNLLPGMSLALVSPDACKVHDASQRQGEKSVQRYILGMLSSAADSNSWLANTGHLKPDWTNPVHQGTVLVPERTGQSSRLACGLLPGLVQNHQGTWIDPRPCLSWPVYQILTWFTKAIYTRS
ncbi:hypothetical protein LguiA_019279 [Lonicera macranthoides]